MAMRQKLSLTASLIGDPGRAAIVLRLMGGNALPAGELAVCANVAPQTASEHLAKLLEGGLLSVERQGRHRYYRLAGAEVADAIEALMVLTARPKAADGGPASREGVGSLAYARTCYGHLAGWLGVRITEGLEERGLIKQHIAKAYSVTPPGREWFDALGIAVLASATASRNLARPCLDWTERRHHIAGVLGCAMYSRFRELGWLMPVRGSRAVRVSLGGRTRFWKLLGISLY
jgi:DNA-binding transcriptional ArsR family regulator